MAHPAQFQTIKDILSKLFADSKWNLKRKQYALWEQWECLVGTEVAKQAQPLQWSKDTLVVGVKDSCWLQELRMKETELLQKIRTTLPEISIKGIRWRLL